MSPEDIAKEIVRIATDNDLAEMGGDGAVAEAVRAVVIRHLHPDKENPALMRLVDASNVIGLLSECIEELTNALRRCINGNLDELVTALSTPGLDDEGEDG